ncbi:MAG: Na+ dependent nucleoside transporter N-terminal domain-containing protein [Methyloceanibacter sp.]
MGNLALQSAFGVLVLLALTFAISEQRSAVSWRNVLVGLGVTVTLAVLCLKVPPIRSIFAAANAPVEAIAAATRAGTSFVFGSGGRLRLPIVSTTKAALDQ